MFEVQDLRDKLFAMGVGLIYAGRATETLAWLRRAGEMNEERERHFYPTIKSAVKACQSSLDQGSAGAQTTVQSLRIRIRIRSKAQRHSRGSAVLVGISRSGSCIGPVDDGRSSKSVCLGAGRAFASG